MGWLRKLFGRDEEEDVLLRLRLRLTRLRHFLWTEQAFLGVLADLSEKLWGEFVLDRQFVVSGVERAFQEALRLAYDCGVLCGDETGQRFMCLDDRKRSITDYLGAWPLSHRGPLVVPIAGDGYRVIEVGEPARDVVAALGRGLASIPDGFIITCQGLLALLDANELTHLLRPCSSPGGYDWEAAYAALAEAIPRAAVPAPLAKTVDEAVTRLTGASDQARGDPNHPSCAQPELVLWPSPMLSASGRTFPSLRTVSGEASLWRTALDAWAGFYADAAQARLSARLRSPFLTALVVQRRPRGGRAVLVRTLDPECLDPPSVRVQPLVEGGQQTWRCSPDVTGDGQRLARATFSRVARASPAGNRSEEERNDLIDRSLAVERLTHRALQAAWQIDEQGRPFLLELRRLDAVATSPRAEASATDESAAVLPGRGHICGGVACGPVVHSVDTADMASFPEGGVLVIPKWSGRYAAALPKAAALILGSPPPYPVVGEIRALGIPAVLGPTRAFQIPAGTVVTVDGEEERVLRGRLDALCVRHLLSGARIEDQPEYQALEGVLHWLGHPEGDAGWARFAPVRGAPATLLDEMLAVHSRVMTEMMDLSSAKGLAAHATALGLGAGRRVPVWFAELDLTPRQDKDGRRAGPFIAADQITSAPWLAFWEGLSAELGPTAPAPLHAANRPLLVTTKRSVQLTGMTADARFLLSARLASVGELNHLYWCWLRDPGEDARVVEEIRCFGRSETETAERLRELGRRRGPKALLGGASEISDGTEAGHG
jgi:pyruvate,water dikinase